MQQKHNPVTQEMLARAAEQRKAFYLEENTTVGVPMRRDLYETARRFFGARGTTPAQAMAKFVELTLETGRMPWEDEGGENHAQ